MPEEGKDQSFIERLEFNPSGMQGAQVMPFDNAQFYDEILEDDAYDEDLIEEMFTSKKRIKICKETAANKGIDSDNDVSNES